MTAFDKLKLNEHQSDEDGARADQDHPDAARPSCETAKPLETPPAQTACAIPPELERAAADAGKDLRALFQVVLSEPKAAQKTARIFLRGLRGPRKKPGRKPRPSTTKALRLLESPELQRLHKSKRWHTICSQVIPEWPYLTPEQRSGAAKVLQDRVYARRRMRRQRRERRAQKLKE
jgi:hypothetical protein